MKILPTISAVVAVGAAMGGCATVALVPGADHVKLTASAPDVTACKAVGNVQGHSDSPLNPDASIASVRNQAVGLGANTVLLTALTSGSEAGVAYSCP